MKIRRFSLSEKFIEPYKARTVPWGPVGYITFKRTYARRRAEFDSEATGTEEWWECCRRVVEGTFNIQKQHVHANGLHWDDARAQKTAKDMYERLFVMKWTPPGRGLWLMGSKFVEEREAGAAGLNNCAFRSTESLATKGGYLFRWIMDALMLGVGVGFDTKGAGTITIKEPGSLSNAVVLPKGLDIHNEYQVKGNTTTCIIADSREGWIETIQVLLDGFYQGSTVPEFDYSEIRAAGTPIKGFGGTSSGYAPLKLLHNELIKLYSKRVDENITSTDIVDTENLIGKCVVAGNVRRSAALGIGTADDREYLTMKDNKELLEHHRWGSNNSFLAELGMDYTWHANQSAKKGEPGYLWLANWQNYGRMKDQLRADEQAIAGVNPCAEMGLYDSELCTLAENFISKHDSYEDFIATLKISYLYAKTITLTKTHWPETNAVMLMNRRIGLGVSGVIQACNKLGRREVFNWLDNAYGFVEALDYKYSNWLCVPLSKKRTTIKPSGTTSKLAGVTPGMHWPEHEHYIQRIRFAETSDLLPALKGAGYHIEPCVYSPNTMVVSFPIKEPHFVKSKGQVPMWEQLELAAQLQYYWSDNGVSVTITFTPNEAKDIKSALEMYETRLKAVSFLRYKETGYKQAPMEPMTEQAYELMIKGVTPIHNAETLEAGIGEKYCTNDSCEIDFSSIQV